MKMKPIDIIELLNKNNKLDDKDYYEIIKYLIDFIESPKTLHKVWKYINDEYEYEKSSP
jgi:hypothetical protein